MIRYGLLGGVDVQRDGEPLDVGGGKQLALLALLVLEAGRVVSLDRIVDALWGDEPPPSAAPSVQAYVSKLRRALRTDDDQPLQRRSHGYRLQVPPGGRDLDLFLEGCEEVTRLLASRTWDEAARTAEEVEALWRGPFVAEAADEAWVRTAARPWEERLSQLRHDRVVALLGAGHDAAALAVTTRLREAAPLDERVCWLHVLALHRVGRSAEALEAWRSFARVLDDELGLVPGPALRSLQEGLLRQDPALARWPRGAEEPAAPSSTGASTAAEEPALVGRDHELGVLDEVLGRVRDGRSAWVLVVGPAGIGKSSLAEEALGRWTAAAGRSARVSCPDEEDLPAWWPLRRLLGDLGLDPGPVLDPVAHLEDGVARFAVADRLEGVLRERAAEAPLLLLVDDLQWADRATLAVLRQLAETSRCPGLGLLLTCRDEVLTPELGRLLTAVARRSDARRLEPAPLGEDHVVELATRVARRPLDAAEAAGLAVTTGGNPLFVSEYARLPASERARGTVPLLVRSVLGRRLDVLDDATAELVRVASVAGDPVDPRVLASVTGLDPAALAGALARASEQRILVHSSAGLVLGHALIRDQLLADLSPVRRQQLSAAVGAALRGRTSADQVRRRAAHLVAAGPFTDPDDVVEACAAAAREAERRWSATEAVRWWERALAAADETSLEPGRRDELVVGLASALVRAGQGQRMLDLVDESLVDAWRDGRTASVGVVAGLLLRLTGCWPWPAYGSDPGPLLSRLAALEPRLAGDDGARARVLAALAIGSCYDLDPTVPEELSRRGLELAAATGDPDVLADALLGRAMTFSGVARRAPEVLELGQRLERLPHRLERFDEVVVHGIASMATLALGDVARTEHHVGRGSQLAASLRLPVSLAQFGWAEGALALWRSDEVDGVDDRQRRALALHEETELVQPVTLILGRLTLRWEQGLLADGLGLEVVDPFLAPWVDAVVAAARREHGAAERLARELVRQEPESWTTHGRLTLLGHAVADLGLVGLVPEVRARLEPYAPFLANFGQTGVVGPVALALGRVALVAGDLEAARRHAEQAAGLCERSGGRNSLLRCRLLARQVDRARGDVVDARLADDLRAEALARGLRGVAAEAAALAEAA